ncbi:hypothetical protein PO909_004565 [Leuciscus waleckii]
MFLLTSILITSCETALVYDRQTLLNIRVAFETARTDTCASPRIDACSCIFPACQCRHLTDLPWKRKRWRKARWSCSAAEIFRLPAVCRDWDDPWVTSSLAFAGCIVSLASSSCPQPCFSALLSSACSSRWSK